VDNRINLYQHHDSFVIDSFDDIILRLTQKHRNDKIKSFLFCGTEPGVGTTTITYNLAISLAQGKNKTLLIDSDMRKLAKFKRLGETPLLGLSDFLNEKSTAGEIINPTNIDNLDFIPCGTSAGLSGKLLSSRNLEKLVSSLNEDYDFILFDSPSLDAVHDAAVLSILVDGIFLVSELGRSTKTNIRKTIKNLSGADNKILGILINKVNKPEYRVYMKNYDYFHYKRYDK